MIQEYEAARTGYTEIRFALRSEPGIYVPGHLLLPRRASGKLPLMICLQGHTSGMHISLGRRRFRGDGRWLGKGDRDFALQAVRKGYAALVIEQRCFGERAAVRPVSVVKFSHPCRHAAMVSLLMGRTMIGERIHDIRRAIDHLVEFPQVDRRHIAIMGHSGGGMSAYFAACLDKRIQAVMVSGYICEFAESIAMIDHCEDNYLPGFLEHFELSDLAGLIAPRPFLIVAGRKDKIFPLAGVKKTFERMKRIYDAYGAGERLGLVVGAGGHRFYAREAWPRFIELAEWPLSTSNRGKAE